MSSSTYSNQIVYMHLTSALRKLRHDHPQYAKALGLWLEGKSQTEISEAMGVTVITAGQYLTEARVMLSK